MNKTTYTVTRFDVDDDFYVEVSPNEDNFDFVLCMNNYGLKYYMFGLCSKEFPERKWGKLIKDLVGGYIDDFYKNVYDVYERGFIEEDRSFYE